MLFILRQLRRSFFQPGKLRTYVAYAIGEILLIVIGILIAVQIGDWKDCQRRWSDSDLELIENLKNDFQASVDRAKDCIEYSQPRLDQFFREIQIIGGDVSGLTVEDIKAARSPMSVEYQPVLGTYRSAESTGDLRLIQDTGPKATVYRI